MRFLQKYGLQLSNIQTLSPDLTTERIAELVDRIDGILIDGQWFPSLSREQVVYRILEAEKVAYTVWPLQGNFFHYRSIMLRLWSGCISGAKCIARGTRSGPNTPPVRFFGFKHLLWHCRRDRIFHAGLKAAPAFKRLRKEGYSYKGGEKKVLEELFGRKFP